MTYQPSPFRMNGRGREQAADGAAADVAGRERGLRDSLANFEDAVAGVALIFVGRHEWRLHGRGKRVNTRSCDPTDRGCSWCGVLRPRDGERARSAAGARRLRARAHARERAPAVAGPRRAQGSHQHRPDGRDLSRHPRAGLPGARTSRHGARRAAPKAVELDPKLADAHFHLGTASPKSGRWEEAVASYRRALALPTLTIHDFVHQNLGLALYHLKRYPEAESSLRFALSLDPKMQAAYYNLGLVLVAERRSRRGRAGLPDGPVSWRQTVRLDRPPRAPPGVGRWGIILSIGQSVIGRFQVPFFLTVSRPTG